MKRKNVFAALVGSMLLCLPLGCAAQAADMQITEQEQVQAVRPPEDTYHPMGNYLAMGYCGIEIIGSGNVRISGYTGCYRKVENVIADVYLYEKTDGGWKHITTGYFSATNAVAVEGSKNKAVERGHYYRAEGAHHAYGTGYHESNVSGTNQIYVP